jgi:transposase InsO family protein
MGVTTADVVLVTDPYDNSILNVTEIISDNGPQFIARDFKEFIRISGMTHVKTSPFYPQSMGRLNVGISL